MGTSGRGANAYCRTGTPSLYKERGLYFAPGYYLEIDNEGEVLPKKVVLYQNFALYMWIYIEDETDDSLAGVTVPLFHYDSNGNSLSLYISSEKLTC